MAFKQIFTWRNHILCAAECKQEKGIPKKFSSANSMIPSPVPQELQNLSQFEEMLTARAFPVIHVYTKPKGGQRAYKGHVITLPQDVQQLADVLPHCPADLPVIIFTINGKDNASRDFVVRKKIVSDALHWLVKNNPLYTEVRIDYNQIGKLPEHGKLENVTRLDCNSLENEKVKGGTRSDATHVNKSGDDHCNATVDNDHHGGDNGDSSDDDSDDHGNIGIDRGPIDSQGDAEVVYDENAEMTSFMPTAVN